jgi:short-subunit dehydrogenase
MQFFKDKVVVVTGGSDGIGLALCNLLLQHGAKVATCARNQAKLYDLQVQQSGRPLHTQIADVSNKNDCARFIHSTIEVFGKIDVLINNAGISMRGLFADTDIEVIQSVMDINFNGPLYCTKFALPSILQNKGSIVNVSSIAGYRGLPGRSGYSASKFALNGFSEVLRTELLHTGVNVMWVCPGFTASNIRMRALTKNGANQGESPMNEDKMMSSKECATNILQAIIARKRTLILTFEGKKTVWFNKLFPSWADKLVHKYFYKNGQLVQ